MYGKLINETYDIEAVIGAGGCGAVYKAWHKRLQKHIVLKQLNDSRQKAVEVRRNEVEALKNIRNMHVPQVFDFLMHEGDSFTVMEYVEGESFDKLLAEGKMFPPGDVAGWYYQLAGALEALHDNDVCHRDIKPGNIIRRPDGDVCLIDFNSALVKGNNTRVISRSSGYASPEQYSYFQMCENAVRERAVSYAADMPHAEWQWPRPWSKKELDGPDWKLSDIYSLGASMYHLLTGNRPTLFVDTAALTSAACDGEAGIGGIIERSMRIRPEERYQSARELREALLHSRVYKTSGPAGFLPC